MLVAMLVGGLQLDRLLISRGQFGWSGGLLVCAFGIPALRELIGLLRASGLPCPLRPTFLVASAILITRLAVYASGLSPPEAWNQVIGTLLALGLLAVLLRDRQLESGSRRLAGGFFAVSGAICLGVMIDIGAAFGTPVLFAFVLTTKSGDIGAYLAGRFLGRRKLIPHISPNKTIEGFVGGFVLTAVSARVLFGWLGEGRWDGIDPYVLAVAIYLSGVLGDLLESLVKRAAGAKDSGQLLPEFGGAFDMLDSLFLAAPIAYGLLRVMA